MDFERNIIFEVLENIVKKHSMVNLHDNGSYPGYDPEDSCLYFDDNGQLVWKCYIGTKDEEVINVRQECTEHVINKILELLLQNKIISKHLYNFLTNKDTLDINISILLEELLDYEIISKRVLMILST